MMLSQGSDLREGLLWPGELAVQFLWCRTKFLISLFFFLRGRHGPIENLIKAMVPFTREMYLHIILHIVSLKPLHPVGPRPVTPDRTHMAIVC